MTSKKHGKYNQETGLPDNRMQPQGSGLNVWLQEQIIERLGEDQAKELITQASIHNSNRYAFMLGVMSERGHGDLVEEYHKRKLADEKQRRIRDQKRIVKLMKQQLETETIPGRTAYLRKEIAKAEKYLAQVEESNQE